MKHRFFTFALAAVTIAATLLSSCKKEPENGGDDQNPEQTVLAEISGVVTDTQENPLEGVEVAVADTELKATTAADGSYKIADIKEGDYTVNFTKEGFSPVSYAVKANMFKEGKLSLNPSMEMNSAKIQGLVLDLKTGEPLADATVTLSTEASIVTGADGVYVFENLTIQDYTVTATKADCGEASVEVKAADFVDGVAVAEPLRLGVVELLRNRKYSSLVNCNKWYLNEYMSGSYGGRNKKEIGFLTALKFMYGRAVINEGLALLDNEAAAWPANEDVFQAFGYGRKLITADNSLMAVQVRTFPGFNGNKTSDDQRITFGVQIIDLNAPNPVAEKAGTYELTDQPPECNDFVPYHFDLSKWEGKEVVVALGTYRTAKTPVNGFMPIRRIAFWNKENADADNAALGKDKNCRLPGTNIAGIEDWDLKLETVRSIMPNEKTKFEGVSEIPADGDLSFANAGYRAWNEQSKPNKLLLNWRPIIHGDDSPNWNIDPLHAEGTVISTNAPNGDSNDLLRKVYFFSKFSISDANDHMSMFIRTYTDTNPSYIRVTAIDMDGVQKAVAPSKNNATSASAVEGGIGGIWKFIHNSGNFAKIEYDFSEFKGKDIVICISVHRGENGSGASKTCFNEIDFD